MGAAYPASARVVPLGGDAARRGGCAGHTAQRSSTSARGSMLPEGRSNGDLRHLSAASPATSDRLRGGPEMSAHLDMYLEGFKTAEFDAYLGKLLGGDEGSPGATTDAEFKTSAA